MKLYFKLILCLLVVGCKPFATLQYVPSPTYALSDSLVQSSDEISAIISPYKEGLDSAMNQVIGYSPAFLIKSKPSSPLGSFMADAIYEETIHAGYTVDFCVLNYGGIRSSIDSGEITIGDVYELMPFENEISLLKLNKAQIEELIDFLKSKPGEAFTTQLADLPKQEYYWVATSDYLANGGDNYSVYLKALDRKNTGVKIREGLIRYIKRAGTIQIDLAPRSL